MFAEITNCPGVVALVVVTLSQFWPDCAVTENATAPPGELTFRICGPGLIPAGVVSVMDGGDTPRLMLDVTIIVTITRIGASPVGRISTSPEYEPAIRFPWLAMIWSVPGV